MAFSYNKLWKMAIDKGMNKTQLRDYVGITSETLSRLSKDKTVSMTILGRICKALNCNISDIVEYKNDKDNKNGK